MTEASISYAPQVVRDDQGRFLPGSPYSGQRKTLESALRRTVSQSPERLRAACERLLDIAASDPEPRNSIAAFSLIADRLDGKAVARIETSEGDTRSLDLAALVSLVMQHRKSEAIDAPHPIAETDTPPGTGDIPVE